MTMVEVFKTVTPGDLSVYVLAWDTKGAGQHPSPNSPRKWRLVSLVTVVRNPTRYTHWMRLPDAPEPWAIGEEKGTANEQS